MSSVNDRVPLGRRVWRGLPVGLKTTLDPHSSLLVVGPTQAGKTSSLVIPAILTWQGALVVTSVKRDVVDVTASWRRHLGAVQVLEPGLEHGLTWNPLEGLTDYRCALRVARDLTTSAGAHHDTDFWNSLAVKLVAALFVQAVGHGGDVFDVAAAIDSREFSSFVVGGDPTSRHVVQDFLGREPRTLDSVLTTAETMLLPWRLRQPLGAVATVVDGANTLYLCSPRGEQRHYEPLFRGAIRSVLERQQHRVDHGRAVRLMMVLDEAATVAALDELDQLAATVAGLEVTLVTVVQDFSQLSARWGSRAATIVNNHSTRLILGGLADPTAGTFLPELVEERNGRRPTPLRQQRVGTANVISGRREIFTVRLKPWWRSRRLRRRGVGAS